MKKILISVAAVALFAGSAIAKESGDSFYIKGALGYGVNDKQKLKLIDTKGVTLATTKIKRKGVVGAIGGGMAFANGLRSELELYMSNNAKDTGKALVDGVSYTVSSKARTFAVFANGYYDIKNGSSLTPYIMAGVGVANTTHSGHISSKSLVGMSEASYKGKSKNSLAYQLGVGVGFKVGKATLDVGYRCVDPRVKLSAVSATGNTSYKTTIPVTHAVMGGVRFNF